MLENIKSLFRNAIYKQTREVLVPISKEGIEVKYLCSEGFENHVSAKEFHNNERPEVFTPSTVIINNGYGIWELEIPEDVRKILVDATIRIETIRTHGMLHTPLPNKSASIHVNDQLVDKIYLVRAHPHGEDYGVDSRRPFPIFRYIDMSKDTQKVKISVDNGVSWDIDRITLEIIVLRKETRQEAAMIIGAVISALAGGLVSFFIKFFIN